MDHWRNQIIPGDKNNWKQKHSDPKSVGYSKSSSKREVYRDTCLPEETRNLSNNQPNLIPKGTRDRRIKQKLKLV